MDLIAPSSPLTNSSNVVKHCSLSVNRICCDYSKMGIDVNRFFKTDLVQLYECLDSGYRFYYPFSCIGDAAFYKDLSKSRPSYYSQRWEHSKALNYIDKSDFVLEIGSGFGAFLNRLKKTNIKSVGLELNPHAVEVCTKNRLKVKNILIENEAKTNKETYDVVCSFQVLEHIGQVGNFLQASIDSLKKGGKLIIGVPNNNPYLFINDKYHTLNLPPHHAGLWNKKSLKSLEKIFPLKLKSIEFEPLDNTYSYFLNHQIKNNNKLSSFSLKLMNKFFPRLLKKTICKFINGRNVLTVFEKQ